MNDSAYSQTLLLCGYDSIPDGRYWEKVLKLSDGLDETSEDLAEVRKLWFDYSRYCVRDIMERSYRPKIIIAVHPHYLPAFECGFNDA